MSNELETLRKIAAQRRAIEASYREALQAARDTGLPASRIGEAAGTTRQNVLKLTTTPATVVVDDLALMVARLEELDARWDRFVDSLAGALFVNPDAQREQLKRNTENGKRKRKHSRAVIAASRRGLGTGRGLDLLPTVKSDGQRAAETFALRFLEDNSSDPRLVKVIGELDEAAALREQVTTRTDPDWLHD